MDQQQNHEIREAAATGMMLAPMLPMTKATEIRPGVRPKSQPMQLGLPLRAACPSYPSRERFIASQGQSQPLCTIESGDTCAESSSPQIDLGDWLLSGLEPALGGLLVFIVGLSAAMLATL